MPPKDAPPQPVGAAPRFALGWAAAVCALATLALAYPALAGGFLVNPRSDQYIAGYAFRDFAAQSLRAGKGFPLWEPYLFGGMPFVASMHGDIFYPTFLLRMILPTDVAMTWGFIIHLFLAGLFTYVFLRRVGLGFAAAIVGGLAYMLSGQIASLVSPGHDGKLFINALFPMSLYLLHQGIRGARSWAWGALAFVIGLAVLSPHPQLLQYLLLASGAYALHLAYFGAPEDRLPRDVATKRLLLALLAIIVGGAMGAIQYMPVREYVAWSPRAAGMSGGYEHATSYSMPPEELINTYLPQFSGILDNYWGKNGIHLHSEYLGAAALLLAGAAFGAGGTRRRRAVWFWTGILAIATLWALGGNTGFYRLVYAIVPGTKFFRAPSTIFFVTAFAVAVLAAIGTERVLAGEVGRKYLFGWVGASIAITLLALVGGFTNMAQSMALEGRYDFVASNAGAVKLGAFRSLIFVLGAAAIAWFTSQGRLKTNVAGWLLAALVALDLWSIDRHYWLFSPPAKTIYATDSAIEYVKAQPQPGRVLPIPGQTNYRDPFLSGDALWSNGVRQVIGYHGNELGRFDQLVGKDEGYRYLLGDPNVWKLLNVRYIYTESAEAPIPGMRRLAGPAKNAAGSIVYLYEMPGDNRYAWVTPVIVKAPDEQVLGTVLDPRFDIRRAALFDTSAKVMGQQIAQLPDTIPVAATVTKYEPGKVSLRLDGAVPQGAALIVSENYYPGWTATVDGKAATVGRADFVLTGVELPAGAKTVELSFDSAPYHTGKMVTLLALALAILAWIGGAVIDRRRLASA